ncbi:hypothetical protein OQA88_2609 [Cercophora sp. LCS_1]
MDPISAFQLAAAVISVVDFGSRLLSDTYEIYQSGTGQRARDLELSTASRDLAELSAQLQNHLAGTSDAAGGSSAVLFGLSQQCIKASAELQRAINEVQANMAGTGRIGIVANSFVSALKAMWKASEIERLKESLSEIRSQMTVATLVSIWQEARHDGQRHTDLRSRLDDIAAKLDRRDKPAQQFAKELMQMTLQENSTYSSRRNADLTKILWGIDWTAWAVGNGGMFDPPQPAARGDVPAAMKIMGSLSFSDMKAREEAIPEAHARTFEWVFKDQQPDGNGKEVERPSLTKWLQDTNDPLYWITGKPGSGKSTLMKFVFEHPQLRSNLKNYAGELPLLLAGFFFWNPGSEMQKSHEGLIRTLLYQCLNAWQDLIPAVAPRRWALYNLLGGEATAPEWTWQELKESFQALCSYHGKKFQLALFVDGLDEFEEAERLPDILINWIKDTTTRYNIKFCVSSRPWPVFSDAFRRNCSLTMQSLTGRDIEDFVRAEFDSSPAFQDVRAVFPSDANLVVEEIIEKAEGVFLWVSLVVRSLLSTLIDTPSLHYLRELLTEIPSDIMGLYTSIWRSIPVEKLPTASKILQLCEAQKSEDVVTFWLASEGPAARARASVQKMDVQGVADLLKRLLSGHTRGICELTSGGVQYLHRSARDWLFEGDRWAEIRARAPAGFEPNLEILETRFALAETPNAPTYDTKISILKTLSVELGYARAACSSAKVGEDRIIAALDTINWMACDRFNRSSRVELKFANVPNDPCLDGFSPVRWMALYIDPQHGVEESFVGLAARAGFVAYTKAKVEANRILLEPKHLRISLLESVIFWDLESVRIHIDIKIGGFIPGLRQEERSKILRFLLDTSDIHYQTAFGDSIYDVVHKAKEEPEDDLWSDSKEWYTEVLELLEQHGYGPSKPGNYEDSGEGKKSKKRRGFFKRIMASLRSKQSVRA